MYVGDNDATGFPVTVPPGNANEEFAGNRLWRNTGISENSTTNIGSLLVNWEWDTIPTQAQYLEHQPTGSNGSQLDQRPSRQRQLLAPGRGTAAQHPAAPRPARNGRRGHLHRAQRRHGLRHRHDAVGLRPLQRSRRTNRAGHLQRLLRHGRPARNAGWRDARPRRLQPATQRRLHDLAEPDENGESRSTFDASLVDRPRRHDRQIRMGPRRQRQLRDQLRLQSENHPQLPGRGRSRRPPARHRQQRRDRPGGADDQIIDNQPPTASFTANPQRQRDRRTGGLQRLRARATPTARSPNTSGTSTATGPTRRTAARPRKSATPSKSKAPTRSASR